jgi:NADPH:quinone reductase-like Zn-dependent oxidoreductase
VDPGRIDTIADVTAVQQYRVKAEGGASGISAEVLAQLAALIADSSLEMPIAATFPLDELHAAFKLLEKGHTRGKAVLLP